MTKSTAEAPTALSTEPNDPARTGLECVADGKMWRASRLGVELDQAGLTDFRTVMRTSSGHCLRVLDDRENWRLELAPTDRPARGVYLKKHHVRTLASWLRAKLGVGAGQTAGRVEAENVDRLQAGGIGVMRLVAYGEELHGDGRLESFVLTEELEGYEPLDDFLRRRFARVNLQRRDQNTDDLQRLIRQVADIARRFHRSGYNHRDFYCCHFFVTEPDPGRFEIKLIDLQRVQRRSRFRSRWLVKDLAQLAYSAPRDRVACTDRLAFVKAYLGVKKLGASDKRLIRRVLLKQRLMQWKRGAGDGLH